MKKNFSQPFDIAEPTVSVIIQDMATQKFAVFSSDDKWDEGFYEIIRFKAKKEQIALQLARTLYERGFDLIEYRLLNVESGIGYSFMDDTPGAIYDSLCFHAWVRILDSSKHGFDKTEWLELKEFVPKMESSHSLSRNVDIGLMRIYFEPETMLPND